MAIWLGWGYAAPDHGVNGLYVEGPQPAVSPLQKYIHGTVRTDPVLSPEIAKLVLTREGKARRLKSLRLGRNRYEP